MRHRNRCVSLVLLELAESYQGGASLIETQSDVAPSVLARRNHETTLSR